MKAFIASLLITLLMPAARAACHIERVADIPVELDQHNRPSIQGTINGQPMRALLDTGSVMSMVWRPAVERFGLRLLNGPRVMLYGSGGQTRVDTTIIHELKVGPLVLNDVRFPAAGDLHGGEDLILGEDFLSSSALELDLRHRLIHKLDPSDCKLSELPYWAKTYSMANLVASPHDSFKVEVEVLLNSRRVRARLDTGAATSVLAKSIADSIAVKYVVSEGREHGLGQQSLQTWTGELATFAIGDESINHAQIHVAELGKYMTKDRIGSRIPVAATVEIEMLLGADFLYAHRVLIDNASRKMLFTYEGGPVFQIPKPQETD